MDRQTNRQTDGQMDRWMDKGTYFPFYRTPYWGRCPKIRDRPTDGLMDTPTDVAKDRAMGGQTYPVTVITHN